MSTSGTLPLRYAAVCPVLSSQATGANINEPIRIKYFFFLAVLIPFILILFEVYGLLFNFIVQR